MTVLLDIVLDGIPPSKNRRTRMNTKTGRLYTDSAVRGWMEDVTLQVRSRRERAWQYGEEMSLSVQVIARQLHAFDLDGALPCLVDAVLDGMLSAEMVGRNPPDQWITVLVAWKEKGNNDETHVRLKTEGDDK